MTVNEQTPLVRYTGDGSSVAFSFPFQLFDLDEVVVVLRDDGGVLQTTQKDGSGTYDYTVTGTLDGLNNRYTSGATVTFNTAPPADWLLGLTRDSDIEQTLDLVTGGGFNPDSVEFQLDKLVHIIQNLAEKLARANLQDQATLLHSTDMVFNENARVTGLPLASADSDAVPLRQLAALTAQGDLAFNGFTRNTTTITTTGTTDVDLSALGFTPGDNQLLLFVNGVLQVGNYTENPDGTVTFDEALLSGDRVNALLLGVQELTAVATEVYDIGLAFEGAPGAEAEVALPLPRACTLIAGGGLSVATAEVAATASTVFSVQRNGTQVGTVTFAASGTTGTFAIASDVSFSRGDRLSLQAPDPADDTLSSVGVTLALRID
ncbi:MAG: hypothetical protein V2I24_09275 [Halieaceae bacterium]|jgi:hypothetical protein|nr:hypothetical protein [Halieaceae bacterium]